MLCHPFSIRFDPWPADMGAEVAVLGNPGTEYVDTTVEDRPWHAVVPAPDADATMPPEIVFVDGVRRVEARIVGQRAGGQLFHGAFGAYAVGAVAADPARSVARFLHQKLDRIVATAAGERMPDVIRVHRALAYRPVSTDHAGPLAPERAIHDEMRRAEETLARELAAADVLVVCDGPLTFQDTQRGLAVGWIKQIQELYVPPALVPVLRFLPAGARTPLFAISGAARFARLSWFLRVTAPRCGDSELSGLVRCEVAAQVGVARAAQLADATCLRLPRYAGIRGLHARAPQNLIPIAALESWLRRALGDARAMQRYIQGAIASEAARAASEPARAS